MRCTLYCLILQMRNTKIAIGGGSKYDKIKKMPKEERAVLGRKNREYFEKHLTNEQYVHNYISLLDEIENEHK